MSLEGINMDHSLSVSYRATVYFNANAQFQRIVLVIVPPTPDSPMLKRRLEFDRGGSFASIWTVPDGPFSQHIQSYLSSHGYISIEEDPNIWLQ